MFQIWGSRAFVRDSSLDKLSARAIPCVFLDFPPDAPIWPFYHPTLCRVLSSQDITFDESVPFYDLFPYHSAPPPPPPLFLAPNPPPVLLEPGGAEPGGAEPEGVEPGGAESEGAESGGAEPRGAALSRGHAGASPRLSPRPEPLSPQQLREWLVPHARLWSGAARAGAIGHTGASGAGVTVGAGGTGGTAAAGRRCARTRSTGAGGNGTGGARAGGAGAVDPGAGGAGTEGASGTGAGGTSQQPLHPASPLPTPSPYIEQSGGLRERCESASCLVSHVRTARRVPCSRPPPIPGTHAMVLRPSPAALRVPLPAPLESALPAVPDLESDRARAASPTVSRLLSTVVTDPTFESTATSALVAELLDFAAACCLDYATALVAECESASPPSVRGECALGTDVLEETQEDFECLAAAVPCFASMLLAPEGDPDAPDNLAPRSCAEAITGLYSSQWQASMIPRWHPGSPQGVDYFQTFSPTPKMTTLRVLLHVAVQREYELHSLDFSTAFLQGSLHEEIWLHHPPGGTALVVQYVRHGARSWRMGSSCPHWSPRRFLG
ncbi:unnamed protein product [Closterium sp. NIES-54]